MEAEKGILAPGMLADLAVLSGDPTAVAPERIRDIRVRMTLVGGKAVFERPM
jgi:predicted amidohydrolase YtcJ